MNHGFKHLAVTADEGAAAKSGVPGRHGIHSFPTDAAGNKGGFKILVRGPFLLGLSRFLGLRIGHRRSEDSNQITG